MHACMHVYMLGESEGLGEKSRKGEGEANLVMKAQ